MKKIIIGFTGKAGSGKDTAASFLKGFEHHSFASGLKEATKILFSLSNDQLTDYNKKEEIDVRWNKSPRQLLQWLGTDVIRKNMGHDFFIKDMKYKLDKSNSELIVITDVRFTNEAEFIKSLGGKIFKITRPECVNCSNHVSECGISNEFVDFVVCNDGTLEKLKYQIHNHLLQAGFPFFT